MKIPLLAHRPPKAEPVVVGEYDTESGWETAARLYESAGYVVGTNQPRLVQRKREIRPS